MSRRRLIRPLHGLVFLVLWLGLLAGCGGPETPTPTPTPILPSPTPTPAPPTFTPTPTSAFTPTPTPTSPAPEAQATPESTSRSAWTRVEDRADIRSYRLQTTLLVRFPETGKELTYLDYEVAVDRDRGASYTRFLLHNQPQVETIRVGEQIWHRTGDGLWNMSIADQPEPLSLDLMEWLPDEDEMWEDLGEEEVDGQQTRHYRAEVPQFIPLSVVIPFPKEMGIQTESVAPQVFRGHAWVREDGLVVQALLEWEVVYQFADGTSQVGVETYRYRVWDVNEPITIEPPAPEPQAPIPVPENATPTLFRPGETWWYRLEGVPLADLVAFYADQEAQGQVRVVERVGPEEYGYVRWILEDAAGQRWSVMALPTGDVVDLTITPVQP